MKYGHFLKPTDSILFEQHDKSSPFNSTHHIVLYQQNGDRIVTTDSVVTSLHTRPMYYEYFLRVVAIDYATSFHPTYTLKIELV